DSRAFHFVTADEINGLPRFCCHGIPPHFCPVTALRQIHRIGMPCRRGHGFAVLDVHDARLYTGEGAKDVPNTFARRTLGWLGPCNNWATLRLVCSAPGQNPWGWDISQTERAMSFRHGGHALVTIFCWATPCREPEAEHRRRRRAINQELRGFFPVILNR